MGKLLKRKYAPYFIWAGIGAIAIMHIGMFIATTTMSLTEMHTHAVFNFVSLALIIFGGTQMGGK